MARRSKPIKQLERCAKCHREFGAYVFPVEVLRLAEDIQTLDYVQRLLARIDVSSISDGEDGYPTLRRLTLWIGELKRIAEQKLRYEYNSGNKIMPREKPQTVAAVWQRVLETVQQVEERAVKNT